MFSKISKRLGVCILICALVSSNNITIDAAINGKMEKDNKIYNGMQNIQFKTPTGSVTMNTSMTEIVGKGYNESAYSFNDPRSLTQPTSLSAEGLDSKVNQEMVSAILLYEDLLTLQQIQTNTGLNITQEQLVEAVQLSIWRQSSLAYSNYQIIETSISDSTVRSLSTAIDTWATSQISNKPANTTLINYLLPQPIPKLNASQAKKIESEDSTTFGPYSVESVPKLEFIGTVQNGSLIINNTPVDRVVSGDTFYVKYPKAFSGVSIISLKGRGATNNLAFSKGRVWIHKEYKDKVVDFNVSTVIGSNGTLNINVVDSLTSMPVDGATIHIKTESTTLTTLTTDTAGKASYQLPVGEYTISTELPAGFVPLEDYKVNIIFIGDIQTLNLVVGRSEGIVNFYVIDGSTLGTAGYAEAYIMRDNVPVKRIAFEDGRCVGITLPADEYTITIYKSTNGYSLSDVIPFKATAGEIQNLNIQLAPDAPLTTVKLEDKKNREHWKMSFYQRDVYLFSLNTNGEVTLPFKIGEYQVIAHTEDNTYKSLPLDFNVAPTDSTVIIPMISGDKEVTFNFTDTIIGKPIPSLVVGLFDDNHNLLQYGIADINGRISFDDIREFNVYYVNILAAPSTVSGYSSVGNRFIGSNSEYTISLYSMEEIKEVTDIDTIYRIENITYSGDYTYASNP